MWPFRLKTIFRNRWWTLAWAVTICWSAVSYVGDSQPGNGASPAETASLQAAVDAFGNIN